MPDNTRNQTPENACADARVYRFVLPKKGRLRDDFTAIFERSGLTLTKPSPRVDFGTIADKAGAIAPCEGLTQRPSDSLQNLADGYADLAVVGRDNLREFNEAAGAYPLREIAALGISKCRLVIAAPDTRDIRVPGDLSGLRVATSYPGILRAWLRENGVENVAIRACDGGVEDTIRMGAADVVCDLVQTGETLRACGLKPVLSVMDSEAVLVARADDTGNSLTDALALRLTAAACRETPALRAIPA